MTLTRSAVDSLQQRLLQQPKEIILKRRTFVFIRRPLDLEAPNYRHMIPVEIRELAPDDIPRITYIDTAKKRRLYGYLKSGCRGWIGCIDERIVSFVFTSSKPIHESQTGMRVPVEEGQVYLFDGMVEPNKRGKSIGVSVLTYVWAQLYLLGFSEAISFIERENRNTYRLHKRLGYEPYRVCEHYKLLGRQFHRWRKWRPGRDVF